MKSWCDLSWREKCKIESGEVNPLSYSSGYSFDIKTKVKEGIKEKDKNEIK